MIRSALVSACAVALAACSSTSSNPPSATPVVTSSGTPVVSAGAVRSSHGLIESISLAPDSASAGSTRAAGPYRVTLRMDDGSTQSMTTDSRAFLVGDRVQVTPEGRLIRQ